MGHEIIIVGASGLGKEVLWLAQRAGLKVQGFLDDAFDDSNQTICGLPILGSVSSAGSIGGVDFAVAIGSPRTRKQVVESMQENGVENFTTLIDPAAMLGPSVSVGKGSIICAGAMATADIEIGEFTLLDRGAVIGHDSNIGAFTTIAPLACISGNVTIRELVEVGTCSSVRQNQTLGTGSLLGMGAVLVRDLEENEVAVGNPAKTLRFTD